MRFSLTAALVFPFALWCCNQPDAPLQVQAPVADTVTVVAPVGPTMPRAVNPLDTILLFVRSSDTQLVTIRKALVPDFTRFASFIGTFASRPLRFTRVRRQDVTGDGQPELLEANVRFRKGRCFALRQITQNDHLLWTDTFRVDDDQAREYWGPSYYQLREPLAFYEGAKRCQFKFVPAEQVRNKSTQPEVIALRRQALEAREMEAEAVEDALLDYQEYLRSFSGPVLQDSDPKAPALWIWYQPEHAFVKLGQL